eukprot:6209989-Pleurochrysis_carterae.AAC.1
MVVRVRACAGMCVHVRARARDSALATVRAPPAATSRPARTAAGRAADRRRLKGARHQTPQRAARNLPREERAGKLK